MSICTIIAWECYRCDLMWSRISAICWVMSRCGTMGWRGRGGGLERWITRMKCPVLGSQQLARQTGRPQEKEYKWVMHTAAPSPPPSRSKLVCVKLKSLSPRREISVEMSEATYVGWRGEGFGFLGAMEAFQPSPPPSPRHSPLYLVPPRHNSAFNVPRQSQSKCRNN